MPPPHWPPGEAQDPTEGTQLQQNKNTQHQQQQQQNDNTTYHSKNNIKHAKRTYNDYHKQIKMTEKKLT